MTSKQLEDRSSAANFTTVTIRHLHLEWNVDFEEKRINGTCTLSAEALQDADEIILDSRDLDIKEVKDGSLALKFKSEEFFEVGQKLVIELGSTLHKGEKRTIEIAYSTSKNGASALQFLEKEQTADKTHPYLYSQCQAIHARSIAPCMDTPSVKQTYSAEVLVPKEVTCLMSGLAKGSECRGEKTLFRYEQPMEIPSYLLAIVVGALEKRDISHRCCVWSEPSVVDKARWEFEDTESMLQVAEELMGKYEWGRYDLVVLPPTFTFGGMENPCLTFVTPTLLVGDRSLVSVISHEIAHSWTGNLVTNVNWEHFWLNEGFTVFMERKILGRLYGKDARDFNCIVGWEDGLSHTIDEEFSSVHEYTKLCPDLPGIDPDDCFSRIPYEKGSALLLYLEQQLGDEARFEQMLRDYIKKFRSVSSQDFIDFLKASFPDKHDLLSTVDFDGWLHKPGYPPNKPKFNDALVKDCVNLAKKWSELPMEELKNEKGDLFKSMLPDQKANVLNTLQKEPGLAHERVELLGQLYGLNTTRNYEILLPYLLIGIKAKWPPIIPPALELLRSTGRMRYTKPVYTALLKWPEARMQAVATFEAERPFMHPIGVVLVQNLLKSFSL